jgi:hypothetical protein
MMKVLFRSNDGTISDARTYFDDDVALFTGFYDNEGQMLCEGDIVEIAPNVKSPLPPTIPVGTNGKIGWDVNRGQWVFFYDAPDGEFAFGKAKQLAVALPGEIIEKFQYGFRLTLKKVR